MCKSKKSILLSIVYLLILIIMITSGCTSSDEKTSTAEVTEKRSNVVLFPAYAMKDGVKKWGYINSEGTFVITPQFDGANDFQENGLARIEINSLSGLINEKGEIVLQPTCKSINDFSEGLAIGKSGSKSVIINDKGAIILSTDDNVYDFKNGFAIIISNGNGYGYIDKNLNIVEEPTYRLVEDFSNNKALVRISSNKYQVIDNNFNIISTLNYGKLMDLSEDKISFLDKDTQKYGYINIEGKIEIKPTFNDVESFKDGLAIVYILKNNYNDIYFDNYKDNYRGRVGVINEKGKYVIKPSYSQIKYLGNNFFAATKLSRNGKYPDAAPKSLLNAKGKKLTDFKYFNITSVSNNKFLVTDDKATYFIDNNGKEISSLPKFTGSGSATIFNDIIKAVIDNKLSYTTRAGKVIWEEGKDINSSNGVSLNSVKYSPNQSLLIYYPELKGLSDNAVQTKINDKLKKFFLDDSITSNKLDDGSYAESISKDFQGSQNKDLLTILMTGYISSNSGDCSTQINKYYNIDLKTGEMYKLSDLFKNNSEYISKIFDVLKIEGNERYKGYYSSAFSINPEKVFYLTKDTLNIFFEIDQNSSIRGVYPKFSIPYSEIKDIINTEGDLWKSFDK